MLTYTNKSMLTLKYIKNKKLKKSIFGDGLYKYGSYVMQVVRVTLVTKLLLLTAMITNGYVININWAYIFFGLRVEQFILSIKFIYNWKKKKFQKRHTSKQEDFASRSSLNSHCLHNRHL